MLKIMAVSNKRITIDEEEIVHYIKKFQPYELNNLLIYEIPEVCFNRANGKLTVYVKNGQITKLSFLALNALNIFSLSSTFNAYDIFLNEMKANYRQRNETQFYNKRYEFKITKNNSNYMIIIKGRTYETNEI
jgi:hypothetical protein